MQIAPSEDCLTEQSEGVPQEGAVYLDKPELRILRARSEISQGYVHIKRLPHIAAVFEKSLNDSVNSCFLSCFLDLDSTNFVFRNAGDVIVNSIR